MSVPFSNTNLRVPRGFGNLLEGLTREVLREQPGDIPLFASKYFETLLKQRQELKFEPAEWGASLDDRFYNNHAFNVTRCRGVTFDSDLTFSSHIQTVTKYCYFQHRNIARVCPFLTQDTTKVLFMLLVISRLDYCNSFLIGPNSRIAPLQSVMNAGARLIFLTKRTSRTSPLCRSLHWLPVHPPSAGTSPSAGPSLCRSLPLCRSLHWLPVPPPLPVPPLASCTFQDTV
uniref:RIIa domain-containing protein n=1 Tax=Leptobrachium leishanense TaxID=445787 RepID=A0A8C5QND8_9ANUR